jgi:hypothetical protein
MVPVKTVEGQAELGTRRLRLGQRHRTVLLLVDGRRTEAQVRELAAHAGVPAGCFEELLALGLIAQPEARRVDATAAAIGPHMALMPSMPPGRVVEALSPPLVSLPATSLPAARTPNQAFFASTAPAPAPTGPIPLVVVNDSLLPACGTLPPDSSRIDSVLAGAQPPDSWLPPDDDEEVHVEMVDAVFAQAREMLQRAVRSEAPWAGSLTLLRLRRARTRGDLTELLDEVEARISKPHRSLASTQLLTSVRQLLGSGVDSSRSAA